MLLQQMWMAGLDWDEELTEPLTNAAWACLTQLQIPQCLLLGGKQIDVSLHTFVGRYSYQDGTTLLKIFKGTPDNFP